MHRSSAKCSSKKTIFLTPACFYAPVPSLVAGPAYILSPDVMAFTLCALISSKGLRTKQEGASGDPPSYPLSSREVAVPSPPWGPQAATALWIITRLSLH